MARQARAATTAKDSAAARAHLISLVGETEVLLGLVQCHSAAKRAAGSEAHAWRRLIAPAGRPARTPLRPNSPASAFAVTFSARETRRATSSRDNWVREKPSACCRLASSDVATRRRSAANRSPSATAGILASLSPSRHFVHRSGSPRDQQPNQTPPQPGGPHRPLDAFPVFSFVRLVLLFTEASALQRSPMRSTGSGQLQSNACGYLLKALSAGDASESRHFFRLNSANTPAMNSDSRLPFDGTSNWRVAQSA
jgi:hypothetical protein